MTRKKKARNKAGRVPVEMLVDLERDSHPSHNKLKPRQRSQYQQRLDQEKQQSPGSTPAGSRQSRLKSDPAKVAAQSQQLMDEQQEQCD